MTKYLLLYRTPEMPADYQPSPEEMQAMFAQWDAWKSRFTANIVDMGDGLKPDGKVLRGGAVTDGPFVETKEIMGGYSIIQAADYDEAVRVAQECPIVFIPGSIIEVRALAGFA